MAFFGWHFGLLFWILVIAVIIIAIVLLSKKHTKPVSALDVLKERYAKGEINKAEFEQKKKDLEA